MLLTFSNKQIGALLPAFLHVDAFLNISAFGPGISRHLPHVCVGMPFDEAFSVVNFDTAQFFREGREVRPVKVMSRVGDLALSGAAVFHEAGCLLAVRFALSEEIFASGSMDLSDFGYADPAHGFATGTQPYANELTPFEVTPPFGPVYGEAFTKFFEGIGQGISDFIADFGPNGSVAQEISAFSLANLGPLGMGASGGFIQTVQNVINSVANAISGTVAGLYAPLLPTADVINAIVLSLPAYSLNLFLYGMEQVFSGDVLGGLVDAFGLPAAASVGLITMAGLVGAGVWGQAVLEYT